MKTHSASSAVDNFIASSQRWHRQLQKLREIALESELREEFKWRQPCYTLETANVAILHGLKESCAFAFFKGALLKDRHGLLTSPGPNTQSGRWIKFTSLREIAETKNVLKAYIREAIAIEKAGLKIAPRKTSDLHLPEEFQILLDEFPDLQSAFDRLTPGRQRGYIYHFSAPKQSKTRDARVRKFMPQILKGKGLLE